MTVSTPEWTDNYYDNTMLPPLGEANVRMQGAETFNAENKTMVHQIIAPYEPGGYATTYIYRDEKDVKNALWDMASSRMFEYEEEFPEYDWEGSLDSAENQAVWDKKTKNMSINKIMAYTMLDDDNQYSKISLNLDGFRIDGEYGGVKNMARKDGILRAESDAYTYAYNEGHSDSRKSGSYRPTMNTSKEEGNFRRVLKQKAETFNRWSKDEMNEELHGGRDMSFDDWLEDEINSHGNIPLREWGYEEEHDEPEHQHKQKR